jgi:phospholipid/cholesterol/gamma-HCH transport system permease protein
MSFLMLVVYEVQEASLLAARAFRGAVARPFYIRDTIHQMDTLGVGSLVIVMLTGFFTGAVLALQTSVVLKTYGVLDYTGQLVMTTMVRALGPVLTALMLSGRVGSGIAAELGSMVVTEQIDALRALGTSPIKKLVWPRIAALLVMTPALTILCDIVGAFGGWVTAISLLSIPSQTYITSAREALTYNDLFGGTVKPIVFGFIIAVVGCRCGLRTHGGTVGVGRSTTQSVVMSSILIIASDFFLSKFIIFLSEAGIIQ